jgi:hypothetical protein
METGEEQVAGWSVLRTMVAEGCQAPKPRGGHTATLVDKNILVQGGQHHLAKARVSRGAPANFFQ